MLFRSDQCLATFVGTAATSCSEGVAGNVGTTGSSLSLELAIVAGVAGSTSAVGE